MQYARVAFLLALAFCASGCGRAPGVYALDAHEAYSRLVDHKLADFSFARQCGILIHLVPQGVPDRSVTWDVFSSGTKMLSFSARLTADGQDRTKVDIEISKDPDGTEAYAEADFYPRPALRMPLRPALEEAIGAVLEGRAFDESRIPSPKESDSVCNVQRAGLESGRRFSVGDKPGSSTR